MPESHSETTRRPPRPYVGVGTPTWVRDEQEVAIRHVYDERGDAVLKRGSPANADGTGYWRTLGDFHPDDIAPWVSRSEQETILRALEYALNAVDHKRPCFGCQRAEDAIALLRERLATP